MREFAIRKTLGATTFQLFILLTKQMIGLIGISVLLSWPLVYFSLNKWLQDFVYQIEISVADFLLGLLVVTLVVLVTVSKQVLKAARINPASGVRAQG